MPIFKTKDENFFKRWSPEMAYVLGYFVADGNLTINSRGSHYIEFTSCDKYLITEVKKLLHSGHKISQHKRNSAWSTYYRLQIGSKKMFNDLVKLGLIVNKSKTINLPRIPAKFLSSFVLGYFDGDGNVVCGRFNKSDRKSKSPVLSVRFTSGSGIFLDKLQRRLNEEISVKGSRYYHSGWRLSYSTNDSRALFKFLYGINTPLFLKRKRDTFLKDVKLGHNTAAIA